MLRIFFLVFSQLTVGGLALMRLVPAAEIGPGFFRTCASIYLLICVGVTIIAVVLGRETLNTDLAAVETEQEELAELGP